MVSNAAVIAAAGAVWLTGSGWPDLVVALCLLVFLMRSALGVIRSGLQELQAGAASGHSPRGKV